MSMIHRSRRPYRTNLKDSRITPATNTSAKASAIPVPWAERTKCNDLAYSLATRKYHWTSWTGPMIHTHCVLDCISDSRNTRTPMYSDSLALATFPPHFSCYRSFTLPRFHGSCANYFRFMVNTASDVVAIRLNDLPVLSPFDESAYKWTTKLYRS